MKKGISDKISLGALILLGITGFAFIGAGLNLYDQLAPTWLQETIREIRTGQEQTIKSFVWLGLGVIVWLLTLGQIITRRKIVADRLLAAQELAEVEAIRIRELGRIAQILQDLMNLVAHDIKTPLETLLGSQETVEGFWKDGCLVIDPEVDNDGYVRQELPRLFEDSRLAVRCIKGILKIIRHFKIFEDGLNLEIEPELCSLGELVNQAIHLLAPKSNHRNITIDNQVAEEIMVFVDPDYFLQVICNLLGNAIKYSYPNTTVTITVTVESLAEGLTLHITDQGIGIDPEKQGNIFEMYQCVNCPEADRLAGKNRSGIGLGVCYLVAKSHGARMGVESQRSKGSTFSVHGIPTSKEDQLENQGDRENEEE